LVILSVNNTADIYGASRCLSRMSNLFVEDGHEVHVVVPCDGPLVRSLERRGITVHIHEGLAIIDRIEMDSFFGKLKFLCRYPLSTLWLLRLIRRLKVDVVHTNTGVLPSPAMASKLSGRRHIWHLREFLCEYPSAWKVYQHYMCWLSNDIVAVSQAVRNQFDSRLQDRASVIYDGLDDEATHIDSDNVSAFRKSIGAPAFAVGVVGRIKWLRKGQEVLIKAAGLLRDTCPDTKYVIVGAPSPGNDEHLVRLKELVRELRLEDRVIFTGDIRETRDVYGALDVTVVPSVHPEPLGCVVMESMAAGTPVVGSRCGGIPEMIIDQETGLLFSPGDEVELASALARVISDGQLRTNMSQRGRQRFLNCFRMKDAHANLSDLFLRDESGGRIVGSSGELTTNGTLV
jgi:glycosyltransferase involved in cell wall biosynthesis